MTTLITGWYYRKDSADGQDVIVRLEEGSLIIEDDDGQIGAIAVSKLRISAGGYLPHKIILSDNASGGTIISEDISVLDSLKDLEEARHLIDEMRKTRWRLKGSGAVRSSSWLGTFLLIAAIVVALYFGIDLMSYAAVQRVPPAVESQLSSVALGRISKNKLFDIDADAVRRVQEVGSRLTGALGSTPYKFEFHVMHRDEINAYAVPGGLVMLNSGLVAKLPDDAALAAVISHEMGHVVNRHALRLLLRDAGFFACAGVMAGEAAAELSTAGFSALQLDTLRYGRHAELRADRFSVRLLSDAGYDPSAMIDVLEMLDENSPKSRLEPSGYFANHPPLKTRIKLIRAEIENVSLRNAK